MSMLAFKCGLFEATLRMWLMNHDAVKLQELLEEAKAIKEKFKHFREGTPKVIHCVQANSDPNK